MLRLIYFDLQYRLVERLRKVDWFFRWIDATKYCSKYFKMWNNQRYGTF
jgi:hypothetical protein